MKWIALALVSGLIACSTVPRQQPKIEAASVASPHASLQSYQTFSFGLSDPPKVGQAEHSADDRATDRRNGLLAEFRSGGRAVAE
ncbi:MAG TPA: hypothetical protein VFK05_17420 [Polyangiaceae bacterium]|nr:hypothetical protein [Polyangiaceae bacterium]